MSHIDSKPPRQSGMYAEDDEDEGEEDSRREERDVGEVRDDREVDTRGVQEPPEETADMQRSESVITRAASRIVHGNIFVALGDLAAEKNEDLEISKGERLRILETRPDGWWFAERLSGNGERGLVPRTFLAHHTPPGPSAHSPAQSAILSLADAQRRDSHVSLGCHLTPRLSESNLAFHDLHWNHGGCMLRKTEVRVSKLIRLVSVEGAEQSPSSASALLRICLFDRTRSTGRQIVSNVHTVRPKLSGKRWLFSTKRDSSDPFALGFEQFLLRSNYRQADVHLVMELSLLIKESGSLQETSLGFVEMSLLNGEGKTLLINKTYSETVVNGSLFGDEANISRRDVNAKPIVLSFQVRDPPTSSLHQIDSLPDVLTINSLHIPVIFYFRRHAGKALLLNRSDPSSSELVNDLVLALFPSVADDCELLDLFSVIWEHQHNLLKNMGKEALSARFRELFCSLGLCILARPLPPFSWTLHNQQRNSRTELLSTLREAFASTEGPIRFISSACEATPIRPARLCFDLTSQHAID